MAPLTDELKYVSNILSHDLRDENLCALIERGDPGAGHPRFECWLCPGRAGDQCHAAETPRDLSKSQCSHEKDDMRFKGIHCLEEYRVHNKCSMLINIIVLKVAFGPFVASTVNCTPEIFKNCLMGVRTQRLYQIL